VPAIVAAGIEIPDAAGLDAILYGIQARIEGRRAGG